MEASDIRNLQEAYLEVYEDSMINTNPNRHRSHSGAEPSKYFRRGYAMGEEFEIILGYLLDEGYANTLESAEVILENMSEGWIESIFEAFVDPETGKAPSGRSPVENVSYHPKKSVRRKAMGAFAYQMGKEYGGKWKAKTKDPTRDN